MSKRQKKFAIENPDSDTISAHLRLLDGLGFGAWNFSAAHG
jgi:hypothetical protein